MEKSEEFYEMKYKETKDVTNEECFIGSHNCGSCMYKTDHDSNFKMFEREYCSAVRKSQPWY